MFIQTESTPNPNSLKFLLDLDIGSRDKIEFSRIEDCHSSDLAKILFQINGVEKVFFSKSFISINKNNYDWDQLKAPILTVISDFIFSGKKIIKNNNEKIIQKTIEYASDDEEAVNQIIEVLDAKVKPAVAQDGGDIEFKKFKDGIVYVSLQGSCSGCPSSKITLKNGIENLLKHYVREVNGVEEYASV